ncbi:MAG: hypothetical protein A3K18_17660 [Lentisphaerae bacterium RIFOXYA12_64_32]|nr:MAG: hypothetical protein A3K18_17660 [Lentisphaerae bacterium RIFOXYA12_64_32]
MVVLLVVTFFLTFAVIQFLISRSAKPAGESAGTAPPRPPHRLPLVVGGFKLAENVLYHPGHTWAISESPQLVRVGIDDFAAHLVGKPDSVKLPVPGTWIRQGQPAVTVERAGRKVMLVSPIEGTVVDVNSTLQSDPSLLVKDPYADGWVMTVQAPDATTSFRNLIGGALARRWMEDAASSLRMLMRMPSGALAQDGGLAIDDLTPYLTKDWDKIAREFFLT